MTDIVERLRALEARATKGPWALYAQKLRASFPVRIIEIHASYGGAGRVTPIVKWAGFDDSERKYADHKANAALIVAMRNALPDLLAEITTLREAAKGAAVIANDAGAALGEKDAEIDKLTKLADETAADCRRNFASACQEHARAHSAEQRVAELRDEKSEI